MVARVVLPEGTEGQKREIEGTISNFNKVVIRTGEQGVYGTPGYRPDLHEMDWNEVRRIAGYPPMDHATYEKLYGGMPSKEKLVKQGIPEKATDAQLIAFGVPQEEFEEKRFKLHELMSERKTELTEKNIALYIGTDEQKAAIVERVEALESVAGKLYGMSNSDLRSKNAALDISGVADKFAIFLTKDDTTVDAKTGETRKIKALPNLEMAHMILEQADIRPENALFVMNPGKVVEELRNAGMAVLVVDSEKDVTPEVIEKAAQQVREGRSGEVKVEVDKSAAAVSRQLQEAMAKAQAAGNDPFHAANNLALNIMNSNRAAENEVGYSA